MAKEYDHEERYKEAGNGERVNARPDLAKDLKDHLCTVSSPGENPGAAKEPGRGELPPEGEKGRMSASKPWKPMGRKG